MISVSLFLTSPALELLPILLLVLFAAFKSNLPVDGFLAPPLE
jgi:hypothetical protein